MPSSEQIDAERPCRIHARGSTVRRPVHGCALPCRECQSRGERVVNTTPSCRPPDGGQVHDEGDVRPAGVRLRVGQAGTHSRYGVTARKSRRRDPPAGRLFRRLRSFERTCSPAPPTDAETTHQTLHRAACDRDASTVRPPPDLVRLIGPQGLPCTQHQRSQLTVTNLTDSRRPRPRRVVARRVDLQDPADRLDPQRSLAGC